MKKTILLSLTVAGFMAQNIHTSSFTQLTTSKEPQEHEDLSTRVQQQVERDFKNYKFGTKFINVDLLNRENLIYMQAYAQAALTKLDTLTPEEIAGMKTKKSKENDLSPLVPSEK